MPPRCVPPLQARLAFDFFKEQEELAMSIRVASVLFSVLLSVAISPSLAQQKRGPSTPEERAKAVQFAHDLESNPLNPQAKGEREWFTLWLIDVPDITVEVCPRLLGSQLPDKNKFGTEILSQLMFSEAAFMIENPDKAKEALEVHTAGVIGSLKVYEVILREHPKARSKGLDDILAQRDKGQLKDHVQQAMDFCNKRVP
jgi:hypothetical protein